MVGPDQPELGPVGGDGASDEGVEPRRDDDEAALVVVTAHQHRLRQHGLAEELPARVRPQGRLVRADEEARDLGEVVIARPDRRDGLLAALGVFDLETHEAPAAGGRLVADEDVEGAPIAGQGRIATAGRMLEPDSLVSMGLCQLSSKSDSAA